MKTFGLKNILLCYTAAAVTINLYCSFFFHPQKAETTAENAVQTAECGIGKGEDDNDVTGTGKIIYSGKTVTENVSEPGEGGLQKPYTRDKNTDMKISGSGGAGNRHNFSEAAEPGREEKNTVHVFSVADGGGRGSAVPGGENRSVPDMIFSFAPRMNSQHLFGMSEARFSLYLYSDFSCIFCRNIYLPLLELVRDSHGEINLVFRHFPLMEHGTQTLLRSVLSECYGKLGGNRKFWIAASMLYETADYRRINEITGISDGELTDCIRNSDPLGRVRSDVFEGRAAGIVSTPAVVIEDTDSGNRILATGITDVSRIMEEVQRLKKLYDGN